MRLQLSNRLSSQYEDNLSVGATFLVFINFSMVFVENSTAGVTLHRSVSLNLMPGLYRHGHGRLRPVAQTRASPAPPTAGCSCMYDVMAPPSKLLWLRSGAEKCRQVDHLTVNLTDLRTRRPWGIGRWFPAATWSLMVTSSSLRRVEANDQSYNRAFSRCRRVCEDRMALDVNSVVGGCSMMHLASALCQCLGFVEPLTFNFSLSSSSHLKALFVQGTLRDPVSGHTLSLDLLGNRLLCL